MNPSSLGTPNGYGLLVRQADGSMASSDGLTPMVSAPSQNGVYAAFTPLRTRRTLAANSCYIQRFVVPSPNTLAIQHIAFSLVVAATANDSIDLGVYSAAAPAGARLASTGLTAGLVNGATGIVTVPLAVSLPPGVYYAALNYSTVGAVAASISATDLDSFAVATLFGTTVPNLEQGFFSQTPPLPATITWPGGSSSASIPGFALLTT